MILQNKKVVPVYPGNNQNAVPNPEDGKHLDNSRYDIFFEMGPYLIIDHVQRENTHSILGLLPTSSPIPHVVTHSN